MESINNEQINEEEQKLEKNIWKNENKDVQNNFNLKQLHEEINVLQKENEEQEEEEDKIEEEEGEYEEYNEEQMNRDIK